MENQVMSPENQTASPVVSSASSSSPQPKNSKDANAIVAVEESTEKATENNNNNNLSVGSSSLDAMSETRNENPSLRSAAPVRTGTEMTLIYPPRSNKIYNCQFCRKGFSTTQALGGHQNAHKYDREWEKKRKEMEEDFPGLSYLNRYIDKPHLLLGGYSEDALSHDNHLGISLEPLKRRGSGLYPTYNGGVGPMNMTVAPRMTPTSFFTGNSTFPDGSSASRGLGPRPTYGPMFPSNVPPFLHHHRATNRPRSLYPQGYRVGQEDLTLRLGRDNVVVIDDDDDDDQTEEGIRKSWGKDLSL